MLAATYPQGLLGSPVRSPAGAGGGADGGEGTDPWAWGVLVGLSLQASGSGGGKRLWHLHGGTCLLQVLPTVCPAPPSPSPRSQGAGGPPDHFKGPVLAAWPLCFVGRREQTEGAEGCVHSGCGHLALLTVPGSPGQGWKDDLRAGQTFAGRQSIEAPFLGVEGQSPGQRSLSMQGAITTSLGCCRAG